MTLPEMTLPESLTGTTVAVLGGTGPQGRGLARRFAAAGLPVVIGSRSAERATETAQTLAEATGGRVTGADNAEAAGAGDIVVVAVPWDGHGELLRSLASALAGKVVVDCVNPLGFDKRGAYALQVEEGSAAQQAEALLPDSTVVGAFHNVSAVKLEDPEVEDVDTDVLVLGDVPRGDRSGPGPRRHHPRRSRRVRRPAAQRPPGRGTHRQPDQHQPPLQGTRRRPRHRHLMRCSHVPGLPAPSAARHRAARGAASTSCRTDVFPAEAEYERLPRPSRSGRPHRAARGRGAEGARLASAGCGTCSCRRSRG